MKKHSLAMVFLLILTLCLTSAVSASDDAVVGDAEVFESQGEMEMDFAQSDEIIEDRLELSQEDSMAVYDSEIQSRPIGTDYEMGYEITDGFFDSCKIDESGDVLAITNAGYLKINDETTENVLNGIMDASNGYITYEDGNLLSLTSNADSVYVAFFVKNDDSLTIALYNGSTTPLYYGNAGPEMSASLLEDLMLESEDVASFQSILDAWTNGKSDDFSIYESHIPFGLLGEGGKLQASLNYPHEFDLPPADKLGVSGDFDDDAFILKKSSSSDKMASVAVNMVDKSMGQSQSLNLYDLGVKATEYALNYFKSNDVNIPKDYPYLYVLTSAGHVKVNGKRTDDALEGILDTLGSKFSKKHLKSVDGSSLKDLVFYFTVVKNTKQVSYALKYDSASDNFIEKTRIIHFGENKNQGSHSNYKRSHSQLIGDVSALKVNATALNKTSKANVTGQKNSTDNVSNVSKNVNKSEKSVELPAKAHGNPFNMLYTLAAILIVCVIFGMGYRKR